MADLRPGNPGDRPRLPASPPARPRWVKVLGIIAAVVIVTFVILLLAGGEHGPSRHLPGGNPEGHTSPVLHNPQNMLGQS